MLCVMQARAHIPVSLHLFMAAPLLLAAGLALSVPEWRLTWLALGLLATLALTLVGMIWRCCAIRHWPAGGKVQAGAGRAWFALLLGLAALASLLLPLTPGLLLLAMARLVWAWQRAPLPGFPVVEAFLLLAAILAVPPA